MRYILGIVYNWSAYVQEKRVEVEMMMLICEGEGVIGCKKRQEVGDNDRNKQKEYGGIG